MSPEEITVLRRAAQLYEERLCLLGLQDELTTLISAMFKVESEFDADLSSTRI